MIAPIARRVVAAACALVLAGAAAPAPAVEHEFSGSFTAQYVVSNFNNAATTRYGAYYPDDLPAGADAANFFEQRVNLGYRARGEDRLAFVAKFEIDYAYYGDSSYDVGANGGAAVGADQVNLETKNLYLDLAFPATEINVRVGVQEYVDGFEGALIWADAAGVSLSRPVGAGTLSIGLFRLHDVGDVLGTKTSDLFTVDAGYPLDERTRLGAAYYLLKDERGEATLTVHTVGVSAAAQRGPATLNGYVLAQVGGAVDGGDIGAFAGNAGAEIKIGPGAARTEFCFASGDNDLDDGTDNSLQTFFDEYWYGSHHLALLTRDDLALSADSGVIYDLAFDGRGSLIASAGYDLPLGGKTVLSGNLGAGWAVKYAGREGSSLGTEANLTLARQLSAGLSLTVRAAYLFLGNFFDGVTGSGGAPENPWDMRVVLAYSF